jgi:predicted DNA binding CopG/RHH family protein
MKKEKHLRANSIDSEILSKGKKVIDDFDESQEVYVEPKQLKNKLISIRLPIEMIGNLRKIAETKGEIGYQQVIKTYIAEGLIRDNQTIQFSIAPSCWNTEGIAVSSAIGWNIPIPDAVAT